MTNGRDATDRTRWRGVFTALATPFTEDGRELDLERLPMLLRRQAAAGVTGVVPAGTTGESPTLSTREHRALVERCVAIARPLGLAVVAGAGANDTRHAIELHRTAEACGADASLQVVPYYNKPSQAGLLRHFLSIADAAPLPIVLYSIPGRCGTGLEPATVATLARHPHIVALKEASGRVEAVTEIRSRCDLAVLSGDDPLTLPMMAVGASGVVSVASNVVPSAVAGMVRAALEGDFAGARVDHDRLHDLARMLLTLDSNPVPVKAALAHLGLDAGTVRPPLAPLDEKACEPLRRMVDRLVADESPAERAPQVETVAS